MKNKKKKPTLKDIITIMSGMQLQIEQIKAHVFNGDRALDEYVKMKGDKEKFVTWLEEHYGKDDKDNKEAEKE